MSMHVDRAEFEELVEEALDRIPAKFMRRFKNLNIVVEEMPDAEDLLATGAAGHEILGLYTGAGHNAGNEIFSIPPPLPDSIKLFQRNIEDICNSRESLVNEIRLTLLHEVGHYFGMSDEELLHYE